MLSSTELGTKAKVTLEGTTQPNQEEMEVKWSIANEGGAPYNATPTATNTFKWTVKESGYADYDKDIAVLEGTVTIQNKDYTPVTIDGADATLIYSDHDVIDIADYFFIDENAGTPTYELLEESTGKGTLEGTKLTMTTIGTFVIRVSTPVNGVYNKGETTITLTVERATPNVTELPVVSDRTYHPSKTLDDADLMGGSVKTVSGNDLAGTWSWEEADVVPNADNDGYVAVFTPNDTIHYQTIAKTISVNVSKATPYIGTAPTAAAITYGESLSASAISDAVVQYSESDEEAVEGTFAWKEANTKPAVADSDKTEYVVVFTPTDADNYNTIEAKITLTVNRADNTPNMPKETELSVPYDTKTVGEVTLPNDWVWSEEDSEKALEAGVDLEVTAIYNGNDKGNYVTESVTITITRGKCTHTGETEVKDYVAAGCVTEGYTGDIYCKECGTKTANGTVTATSGHDYSSEVTQEPTATENGVRTYTCTTCGNTYTESIPKLQEEEHTHSYTSSITKEPTTTEAGIRTYTCTRCGESYTESIQKKDAEPDPTPNPEPAPESKPTPAPDTQATLPAGTQSTLDDARKAITSANTDKGDVEGSAFAKLRLKATGKNKSVKLTWKKVKDADGYIIYGAQCGKSLKEIKNIKGASKTSYTHKKLKKEKYYKYMVVAYKNINGKDYTIATSKSAHAVTNGGKYANPTKVSVKASSIKVKKGGKKNIKASYTLPKNKKTKVHIAKFRYESSNLKVATVSSKGVVTGRKKGTAYIYVYAQNGVYNKVKVTVN